MKMDALFDMILPFYSTDKVMDRDRSAAKEALKDTLRAVSTAVEYWKNVTAGLSDSVAIPWFNYRYVTLTFHRKQK
jgi:hypothetical protein